MVVVAILGVLGLSVLAIYQDLVGRSRQASDDGTIGSLRSAVSIHIAKTGLPPPDKATLNNLVAPSPPGFAFYTGYAYDPATGIVNPLP